MKKITLNRETLRKLDDNDLTRANGGIHPTCAPTITLPETYLTCNPVYCYTQKACKPTRKGCTTFLGC